MATIMERLKGLRRDFELDNAPPPTLKGTPERLGYRARQAVTYAPRKVLSDAVFPAVDVLNRFGGGEGLVGSGQSPVDQIVQPAPKPAAAPSPTGAVPTDTGYAASQRRPLGVRRAPYDYSVPTTVNRTGAPGGDVTTRDVLAPDGKSVGQFSIQGTPAIGVTDLNGQKVRGAVSDVGESAYSEAGLAKRPGLRRLLEDADIRAGRAKPRDVSAERIARGNQAATLAAAGLRAQGAAAGRAGKGSAQDYRSLVASLQIDPRYSDEKGQLTPAGQTLKDFISRGTQAGYNFSDPEEARQLMDLDAKLSRNAQLHSSVLPPTLAAAADYIPFFSPGETSGKGSVDPLEAIDRLQTTVADLNDPKRDTIRYQGVEIPKDNTFIQNLFGIGTDEDLRAQISSIGRRRNQMAKQEAAATLGLNLDDLAALGLDIGE